MKKTGKSLAAACLAAVLAMSALTACGSKSPAGDTAAAGTETTAAGAENAAAGNEGEKKVLQLCTVQLDPAYRW